MLLCVGNFFGSTSEAEWAEYRTGAKKGKGGGRCHPGAGHCGVKAATFQQGDPTQKGKMVLWGTPLALGLCITLELIFGAPGRALTLQEDFLCCCSQRVVEGVTGVPCCDSWALWAGCWN